MAVHLQVNLALITSLASFLSLFLLQLLMMVIYCDLATAETFVLEAEQYVKDRIAYPRSAASGILAVHFYENETFRMQFCVQSNTEVTVTNVRYSNDGDEDHVEVRLNDQLVGFFRSVRKSSSHDEWNQFENSGQIGGALNVLAGRHVLELQFVSTDRYGIEIDFVAMDVADEEQDEGLLQCTAYCDDSIRYTPVHTPVLPSLPAGRLVQKSHRTICAEEQNVKIELYHHGLSSYRVTSHYPRYRTLLDNQYEDLQNCQEVDNGRLLWLFTEFDLLTSTKPILYEDRAVLNFRGSNSTRDTVLAVRLSPAFTETLADTIPDYVHATLRLRFRRTRATELDTNEMVHLSLALNEPSTIVAGGIRRSTDPSKSDNEVSWVLKGKRDEFLTEDTEFVLTVFHNPLGSTLHVDYLRLEIHPPKEQRREVYQDSMIKVETVTTGSSLNGSEGHGMVLYRPDNLASWNHTQSVVVLKKVRWSEATRFEEIFRLDQDGTMRLKPLSAYASTSPPYGTAVVVGPSDPRFCPPAAPLARVDVDPWALSFTLTYVDSSVSEVLVRVAGDSSLATRAVVTHKRWAGSSRGWPVAVVRSMWVADGKADVDHVSVAGEPPRHVINRAWREMRGTNFAFFRRCVSRHNTQAPDITLDLLQDHRDLYH